MQARTGAHFLSMAVSMLVLTGCTSSHDDPPAAVPPVYPANQPVTYVSDSHSGCFVDCMHYENAVSIMGNSVKGGEILGVTGFSSFPTRKRPGAAWNYTGSSRFDGPTIAVDMRNELGNLLVGNRLLLPDTESGQFLDSIPKNANSVCRVTYLIQVSAQQELSSPPEFKQEALDLYNSDPDQFQQQYSDEFFSSAEGGNFIVCIEFYTTDAVVNREEYMGFINMAENSIHKFVKLSDEDMYKLNRYLSANKVKRKAWTLSTVDFDISSIYCAADLAAIDLDLVSTPRLLGFKTRKMSEFLK